MTNTAMYRICVQPCLACNFAAAWTLVYGVYLSGLTNQVAKCN